MLKLPSRKNSRSKKGARISARLLFLRGGWPTLLERPRVYFVFLLCLTAFLFLWAGLAQVERVVRVEGKIIPAGRSQQIQHLEGGIIASIDTTEGAAVKRGDLLLTIDNTTAGTNMTEGQIKLNSARARVVRLEAEVKNKGALEFPSDIAELPVAGAEKSLFIARKTKLNDEIIVHQNSIKQYEANIREAEEKRARLINELATAHQRLEIVQKMVANGAASKMELLDAQSREQRFKTEMSEAEGALPKLRAAISGERARIESRKAEFISDAHNELVGALEEIDRLKQNLTAAEDRLKRTEIRAPIDGIINRIAVNTVGGVVRSGENLIELIPDTDAVLIEAKANPRDRGYLLTGLDAKVRIHAYDTSSFGMLGGKVTEVSADSIQESKDVPYYRVNVLVGAVPPAYAGRPIVPGMTVTADIVTGNRTFLEYLLSPLRKFTYNMFRDPR